jgi:tRNA nucleotidyltransferase/poly(A) polymerase
MLAKTDGLYAYNPIFDEALKLYKYEIEASLKEKIKDIEHYDELIIRIEQIKEELKEELKKQTLKRLVTGHDIMEFGIKPGPIIAEIMEKIETAQLEGNIKTREEALKYLKEIIA